MGTTREQTIAHAQQCVEHGFDAAMVAGSWVNLTTEVLAGTGVTVASALDFPTVGVMTSTGKAAEAAELVRLGAQEIDIGVRVAGGATVGTTAGAGLPGGGMSLALLNGEPSPACNPVVISSKAVARA